MKILLLYPQYPDTFWSYKHALKFISKKAAFPPLGLLTVASMLPKDWELRLIDMNVEPLKDKDIIWADFVFISAMSIQTDSAVEVIKRCNDLNTKVVAGGPLFTSSHDMFTGIDHFVLNEAEITLPCFIRDLEEGHPEKIYTTDEWADITSTPLPRWELGNLKMYSSMSLQYSRGCLFDCEFCQITVLYGRRPRTKTSMQVIAELDSLYSKGLRGQVFFVDDNFIGNKQKLKKEILPAITEWMDKHGRPFQFNTEASINLADDDELMAMMTGAGFESVFIGIESPSEESLSECNKYPNKNRDLVACVKKIQKAGLEVQGGFILGFDNDSPSIFTQLITFIQESHILTAMIGLLNAPKGTKLYNRLLTEGRILSIFSGNNTDCSMNSVPKMNPKTLIEGYRKVLNTVYSPRYYYERTLQFLKNYNCHPRETKFNINFRNIAALGKSVIKLGIIGKERYYYWKLFFWTLFRRPQLFSLAITFSIFGYHFRRVSEDE